MSDVGLICILGISILGFISYFIQNTFILVSIVMIMLTLSIILLVNVLKKKKKEFKK